MYIAQFLRLLARTYRIAFLKAGLRRCCQRVLPTSTKEVRVAGEWREAQRDPVVMSAPSTPDAGGSLWTRFQERVKSKFLNLMIHSEPSLSVSLPQARTAEKLVHPDLKKIDSMAFDTLRVMTLVTCGTIANVAAHGLNSLTVYDKEKFTDLVAELRTGALDRGLLTVVNHHSVYDEPCVVSNVVPFSWLLDSKMLRWSLCAKDFCFANKPLSKFFTLAKALPIVRGGGIDQPAIRDAISKLDNREWINIFPEGRVIKDGKIGMVRQGVGMMVTATEKPPIVVPIYHTGMHKMKPYYDVMVKHGQQVKVIIGDPIYFDELIAEYRANGKSKFELYQAISDRIEKEFYRLQTELDEREQEGKLWTERLNRIKRAFGIV